MKLNYDEFKEWVNKSNIYLPYSFLLGELSASEKIKKLSRFSLSNNTILEYTGNDLIKDIISTRKNHYIVSSLLENLPPQWLKFNEIVSDISCQCKENISFYMPYYDLNLPSYFVDLSSLKIKKFITLYPPEKEYEKAEPKMALEKLKSAGFDCRYAPLGMHAKVYLFDDVAALIGSFNFTKNAAYSNTELGVLFFGDEVKKLRNFMETMIQRT